MKPIHIAPPVFGQTDGTYWPDGQGTIPLPNVFPDDGNTYLVIDISLADAADTITDIFFNGTQVMSTPVTMTAADAEASANAILTAIETDTTLAFSGTVVGDATAARLVVARQDGIGNAGGTTSFGRVTAGTTVFTMVATPWVIRENGTHGDGTYVLLNALSPGTLPALVKEWSTISIGQWLYFPDLHTLHQITHMEISFLTGDDWGTAVDLTLAPVPGTLSGTDYPILQMPTQLPGVKVANTGGTDGDLDGYVFPSTDVFDRSVLGQTLTRPITYDSSGTSYSISTNS